MQRQPLGSGDRVWGTMDTIPVSRTSNKQGSLRGPEITRDAKLKAPLLRGLKGFLPVLHALMF